MENTNDKIHRYPCVSCGANLVFAPQNGMLTCPYCGHQEQIAASAEQIEERSFEKYLQIRPEQQSQLAADAMQVQCNSCGAVVTFVPPETARECDFCGAKIVAQPKSADPLIAPEGVLPFRLTQKQSAEAVKRWLSSLWFAPSALKQFAAPEKIHGIYLPYWTYDTHTMSHYSGERGDNFVETEYYTEQDEQGNTVQRSRNVTKTNWYPVSGRVERWFDDILVTATSSLPANRLNALQPWDLAELKPYEPSYLSGFRAQRYQVDLAAGFEFAKQVAANQIRTDVARDIGGDLQRIHNVATQYSAITFKHLLLPVYAGAYRFNGKVFQLVVNGRTGQVQGDRPYSVIKIALFVAVLLFILFIVFAILGVANN